jgi:YfiH family protein
MTPLDLIEVPTGAPARAVFTTRRGGVSAGGFAALNLGPGRGDPDDHVRENRARVCAALGIDPVRVSMGRQVHGAAVREVTGPAEGGLVGRLRDWPEGDGLVTGIPGAALAVLGADCLPVLVWRHDRPRVGAAHAGWRGLVAGVVEATVAALGEPAATGAAIGPGIGPCCYPVSQEVRTRFAERFGGGVLAGEAVDLAGAARRALVLAGVPGSAIQTVEACTSCDAERFFSHRRDGEGTGRQAGLIWAEAA